MNQKVLQVSLLGFLAIFAASTQAHSEDVKTWVKENQQAEQVNPKVPDHAYGPLALFLGSAGVTIHGFAKADHLRSQAMKSAQKGDGIAAARLKRRAERLERTGAVTAFLVLPAAVVAVEREMNVQEMRSKLADEKVSQNVQKVRAVQVTPGEMSEVVTALTSQSAAK